MLSCGAVLFPPETTTNGPRLSRTLDPRPETRFRANDLRAARLPVPFRHSPPPPVAVAVPGASRTRELPSDGADSDVVRVKRARDKEKPPLLPPSHSFLFGFVPATDPARVYNYTYTCTVGTPKSMVGSDRNGSETYVIRPFRPTSIEKRSSKTDRVGRLSETAYCFTLILCIVCTFYKFPFRVMRSQV